MNPDAKKDIENEISAVVEAIFGAWAHYHLLLGLHHGTVKYPAAFERYPYLVDGLQRSIWDALFAAIGTMSDRTKGTHSLPCLAKKFSRVSRGDSGLTELARTVERSLAKLRLNELAKFENQRHKVVAHRTPAGRQPEFHARNIVHLAEVEQLLHLIQEILDEVSVAIGGPHHIIESGTGALVDDAIEMMGALHRLKPRQHSAE